MISQEERDSIINEAVEKALLALPEVVSVLFMQKVSMKKLGEEFYKQNPQFTGHLDIVQSVLEELDANNPGKKHKEIFEKAVPIINQRIATAKSLNMDKTPKPTDLSFKGGSDMGIL